MQEYPEPISPALDYVYQQPPFAAPPQAQPHSFYQSDPIFQRLQYEIRAAYEEGWSDGGGDPIRSPHEQEPVGWRAAWMKSRARKFLVANGINTGAVRWK